MMKPLSVLAAAMVAAVGLPATYFVLPDAEKKQARVVIVLDEGETATEFRMPAWAPGDYEIFNYGTKIVGVRFYADGEELEAVHGDDPNLWTIEGGATQVEYYVNESRGNFSPNLRVTEVEMFVSGPGVLGWFVGHADEEHTLQIPLRTESTRVACSLDPIDPLHSTGEWRAYRAVDYDELIDSPFVVGANVRVHEFEAGGKPHVIVGYNKSDGVDLEKFEDTAAKLAAEAKKLFGELPYDRYYYFFDFGGPGGGLEHLDSTKIGLRPNATAQSALDIMAHEYFHTFNVKRIRSKPLGPFDYTKPAVTGALWWLEGVTDYYADVLAFRAGLMTRQQFMAAMSGSVRGLTSNPNRLTVSADECSRRVWEVRRSRGYGGLSYYVKGKNVGLVLDLAIRAYSSNAHSLDDVIRQLYRETINGPGFEEGRIRELCVQFGGQQVGWLYDTAVLQAVDIPYETVFAISGIAMAQNGLLDDSQAPSAARDVGRAWPSGLPIP